MSQAVILVLESDRAKELLAKLRAADMTNEHQMARLVEEYKDVGDAIECALASTMSDNANSTREHFLRLLPTEGPRQHLPLAENTHQSPTSEEYTGPATTLANKNPRPLPSSLKELQKMKYAAVKAYSRYPTPENKEIMQALNRETKQRIAGFKRSGQNSTGMKLSPRREVTCNIVQHQVSHCADENVDDEESEDEDTDYKDTDEEDTNNKDTDGKVTEERDTVNVETKDEYRRRLGDEYKDVIEWAEGLCARALRAYAYAAETTSQTLSVSSETWGLHDDYMSARFNFYMSKMKANFTTEERRQKARFSSEFMNWIRNLEKNLISMLPSPAADIRSLQHPITNSSRALPLDNNTSQSLPCIDTGYKNNDNENTDNAYGDVMNNEDTKSKQTTKDAYQLLKEEYKDIMEWAEELRERALRATSAGTSKSLPVSSDTETWTPRDALIGSRIAEYFSKATLLAPAKKEHQRHNSGWSDDFKEWLFEFGKNMISVFPSARNAILQLNSEQATQRSYQTFTENTSQSQPVANFRYSTDPKRIAEVEDINQPQPSTESTSKIKPSDENINQPVRNNNNKVHKITGDEDSCGEVTDDEVADDEVTDDEVTDNEDTDDEETSEEDTDDKEPSPPLTKNTTQFLSPVANTSRAVVVAENVSKPLPSTGYINRSQPFAENANQFLPPVASTSRYLPLNENTNLNSRRSQPPVRDTRPLPPALKELQKRKFAALKDYSRFPSPDNKRILKDLEREVKRRIAEFRRMEQQTAAIGDRFDDFCSKLKFIDLLNRNVVTYLAEDYKDVLELYFSHGGVDNEQRFCNLYLLEYTTRSDPRVASTSHAVQPANPNVLPPALQELLRRKRAALMIYRGCRSPENKGILRALEKQVKQGLAELRR